MNTENLYWVLSPEAYTALRENLKRQAERERREAIEHVGFAWPKLRAAKARLPWFSRLTRVALQKA